MLAVVTGATSGIGASYAEVLARHGYDLLLTGRRMDVLGDVASRIRSAHHVDVQFRRLELADPHQVSEFSAALASMTETEFLVQSAGYGTVMPYLKMDIDQSVDMIRVHNEAPIRFCKSVIGQMIERKRGYIVNVSSIAGFLPSPGSPMYTATKSSLTVFSESVAMTVRDQGVNVQALCPGFTHTDFHRALDQAEIKVWEKPGIYWMESDEVARISFRKVQRSYGICIPGIRNKLLYGSVKLMPRRLYYRLARKIGGS